MIWKRWWIYKTQAESFKLDDHGVIAVYHYLRTPGPVRLQWLELWMHSTPTHHVSWHKKFHGNVLHSQRRGNFSQKEFKGKKLFIYITASHDINLLSRYRAPLWGQIFAIML